MRGSLLVGALLVSDAYLWMWVDGWILIRCHVFILHTCAFRSNLFILILCFYVRMKMSPSLLKTNLEPSVLDMALNYWRLIWSHVSLHVDMRLGLPLLACTSFIYSTSVMMFNKILQLWLWCNMILRQEFYCETIWVVIVRLFKSCHYDFKTRVLLWCNMILRHEFYYETI